MRSQTQICCAVNFLYSTLNLLAIMFASRREKIKTSLEAGRANQGGLTAISLMERAQTIRTLPELNATSGYRTIPGTHRKSMAKDVCFLLLSS